MLHLQAGVPLGCQQLLMGFADSQCGWWREVGLMMVIMLALSWAAVFICWLQLQIACSVSGSARSDAEWLWFIGFPCSLASVHSSRHLIRREVSPPSPSPRTLSAVDSHFGLSQLQYFLSYRVSCRIWPSSLFLPPTFHSLLRALWRKNTFVWKRGFIFASPNLYRIMWVLHSWPALVPVQFLLYIFPEKRNIIVFLLL